VVNLQPAVKAMSITILLLETDPLKRNSLSFNCKGLRGYLPGSYDKYAKLHFEAFCGCSNQINTFSGGFLPDSEHFPSDLGKIFGPQHEIIFYLIRKKINKESRQVMMQTFMWLWKDNIKRVEIM